MWFRTLHTKWNSGVFPKMNFTEFSEFSGSLQSCMVTCLDTVISVTNTSHWVFLVTIPLLNFVMIHWIQLFHLGKTQILQTKQNWRKITFPGIQLGHNAVEIVFGASNTHCQHVLTTSTYGPIKQWMSTNVQWMTRVTGATWSAHLNFSIHLRDDGNMSFLWSAVTDNTVNLRCVLFQNKHTMKIKSQKSFIVVNIWKCSETTSASENLLLQMILCRKRLRQFVKENFVDQS